MESKSVFFHGSLDRNLKCFLEKNDGSPTKKELFILPGMVDQVRR